MGPIIEKELSCKVMPVTIHKTKTNENLNDYEQQTSEQSWKRCKIKFYKKVNLQILTYKSNL